MRKDPDAGRHGKWRPRRSGAILAAGPAAVLAAATLGSDGGELSRRLDLLSQFRAQLAVSGLVPGDGA
ncbi:hypothetical protein [Microvirga thermotolerans]|uniref:Uncharacterized protein n=1 Tax=Microvirga thermotolerans TaxID=2651334 RepID=A0A5P9JWR0_9HYPH|nr:hypothetical protein [Microvirga thermotolerans]QFU16178.1 hypothetical protein GDR74_08050 [Microvirga thermotolerans]